MGSCPTPTNSIVAYLHLHSVCLAYFQPLFLYLLCEILFFLYTAERNTIDWLLLPFFLFFFFLHIYSGKTRDKTGRLQLRKKGEYKYLNGRELSRPLDGLERNGWPLHSLLSRSGAVRGHWNVKQKETDWDEIFTNMRKTQQGNE